MKIVIESKMQKYKVHNYTHTLAYRWDQGSFVRWHGNEMHWNGKENYNPSWNNSSNNSKDPSGRTHSLSWIFKHPTKKLSSIFYDYFSY